MKDLFTIAVMVLLTLIATAGIVPALRRRDIPPLEPVPDDRLDERRLSLLRSLRDLDEAYRAGDVDEATHRRVRGETEARLAKVLDAMERRMRDAGTGTPVS